MHQDKLQSLGDIIKNKKTVKPPAYKWQQLALWVVKELGIPGFKRSAVFKIAKEQPEHIVKRAVNDTKELCPSGPKWKYFFKIIENIKKENV